MNIEEFAESHKGLEGTYGFFVDEETSQVICEHCDYDKYLSVQFSN